MQRQYFLTQNLSIVKTNNPLRRKNGPTMRERELLLEPRPSKILVVESPVESDSLTKATAIPRVQTHSFTPRTHNTNRLVPPFFLFFSPLPIHRVGSNPVTTVVARARRNNNAPTGNQSDAGCPIIRRDACGERERRGRNTLRRERLALGW